MFYFLFLIATEHPKLRCPIFSFLGIILLLMFADKQKDVSDQQTSKYHWHFYSGMIVIPTYVRYFLQLNGKMRVGKGYYCLQEMYYIGCLWQKVL